MLFRGDQGRGLQDFHNYGFLTFRHCWKMSAVQPNKWPNKQCGPGQDFTGVTFVFGFQSRSASHISPPQSLLRSAAGVSQTARFQRANSQTTQQETTMGVSLRKNNPPRQFQIGVSLLSHYGFENLGERGCWVDDGQRFSTLLRHPVIRVTGCV